MSCTVALIVVAALKLGKDVFRPSRELVIVVAAFALALFLHFNPALLLLAGGVLGALVLKDVEEENEKKEKKTRMINILKTPMA